MAQIVGVSARSAPFQAPATNSSIRGSVEALMRFIYLLKYSKQAEDNK